MSIQNKLIALDADGVLLDYHSAYQAAWGKAFGTIPAVQDPEGYSVAARFGVPKLVGEELETFESQFNHDFWTTVPALPGAVDACWSLISAGFELVCVSAIKTEFQDARTKNLHMLGFPIARVYATPEQGQNFSPKAEALDHLNPAVFVDDYLPYLRGIPTHIHAALIMREPNDSPNHGPDLALAHSTHKNLAAFSSWWLQGQK